MELMCFQIVKPKSVKMIVGVCVKRETIMVEYRYYDCLLYKDKMKNFVINRTEIKSCKIKYKLFLNYVDILFYVMSLIGIIIVVLWEKIIGLSMFSREFFVGMFGFLLFFTFLKFTRILELKLKNGKEYYIPVTGFVVCSSKEVRDNVKKLYSILNHKTLVSNQE